MRMKKKKQKSAYGVIGLGRFGWALAQELAEAGAEVLVVDKDESKVRAARAFTEFGYVLSELSRENLSQVGVGECGTVIICIGGQLDVSLLTALNVINLGVPKVIAKAVSPEHGELLEKIGAEVVYPEKDMGDRLGRRLTASTALEYISLTNDIDITECVVPFGLLGATVATSGLRQNYSLNLIALQRGGETITHIDPAYVFQEGDALVLIGKSEDIQRFQKDCRQ